MDSKQKKTIWITGSTVLLIVALVAAGLVWHGHHHKKPLADAKQTIGNHIISLNQSPAPSNSGGLSVTGQADSLGQLNGDQSSQNGTTSGSSSSNGIDPS